MTSTSRASRSCSARQCHWPPQSRGSMACCTTPSSPGRSQLANNSIFKPKIVPKAAGNRSKTHHRRRLGGRRRRASSRPPIAYLAAEAGRAGPCPSQARSTVGFPCLSSAARSVFRNEQSEMSQKQQNNRDTHDLSPLLAARCEAVRHEGADPLRQPYIRLDLVPYGQIEVVQ
jgi:hypothetical protein